MAINSSPSSKNNDWNDIHIIARGNTLVQLINGHVMSMLIDDDTAGRKMKGEIGIQLHLASGRLHEDGSQKHPPEKLLNSPRLHVMPP